MENLLTPEGLSSIPQFSTASPGSLVRVSAIIQQDSLEDEYYHPTITVNGCRVNTGLWTRFPHDPNGILSDEAFEGVDMKGLQCRKRALAQCLDSNRRFILAFYNDHEDEESWEKWRQQVLKMNSLHDFVGILEHSDAEAETGSDELQLPVIHLIRCAEFVASQAATIDVNSISEIRSKLLSIFTEATGGGSEAAAEALLMSLVSRPAMRVNGLVDSLFIGKFVLNISVEEDVGSAAQNIAHLVRQLKPFVAGPVQVSNDPALEATKAFASAPLYPRFDSQTGLLSQSVLQQPDGCVLVVDETLIVAGEFKDQAVCNLQALIDLIRHQQVNYDFGMQQVAIKTDMPVVLVSSRSGSVLPSDFKVTCRTVKPVTLSPEESQMFRSALEHLRNLNFQIDEEMANFLEQDYVALRKASPLKPDGNPKMNEQELHRLINLARLRAISLGEASLSRQHWEEAKQRYIDF